MVLSHWPYAALRYFNIVTFVFAILSPLLTDMSHVPSSSINCQHRLLVFSNINGVHLEDFHCSSCTSIFFRLLSIFHPPLPQAFIHLPIGSVSPWSHPFGLLTKFPIFPSLPFQTASPHACWLVLNYTELPSQGNMHTQVHSHTSPQQTLNHKLALAGAYPWEVSQLEWGIDTTMMYYSAIK